QTPKPLTNKGRHVLSYPTTINKKSEKQKSFERSVFLLGQLWLKCRLPEFEPLDRPETLAACS
ncbi:hypothetical protein KSS87_017436, partial [Heliosperma pusillum]